MALIRCVLCVIALAEVLISQPAELVNGASPGGRQTPAAAGVLGPRDELNIWALGVPEIGGKPIAIDENGSVDIPLLGSMRAAGLTVDQLRTELLSRLAEYVQRPQVTVSVSQYHSRQVSVVGAVARPGVYQIGDRSTILDVLSLAGGLSNDAGGVVRLTRSRRSPCDVLPDGVESGPDLMTAAVPLPILGHEQTATNVEVCPNDILSVARTEMIYVVGEVQRPGAFPIQDRRSYTVVQAIALAGGTTRIAKPKHARILRDWHGPDRKEIPVDMSTVLRAKAPDVRLQPGDVLYVPESVAKSASRRAAEAALQMAIGIAIFRN